METCNKISIEDENIKHFNVSPNGKVEVRRKGKEIMSSHLRDLKENPRHAMGAHIQSILMLILLYQTSLLKIIIIKILEVRENMNMSVIDHAFSQLGS